MRSIELEPRISGFDDDSDVSGADISDLPDISTSKVPSWLESPMRAVMTSGENMGVIISHTRAVELLDVERTSEVAPICPLLELDLPLQRKGGNEGSYSELFSQCVYLPFLSMF